MGLIVDYGCGSVYTYFTEWNHSTRIQLDVITSYINFGSRNDFSEILGKILTC